MNSVVTAKARRWVPLRVQESVRKSQQLEPSAQGRWLEKRSARSPEPEQRGHHRISRGLAPTSEICIHSSGPPLKLSSSFKLSLGSLAPDRRPGANAAQWRGWMLDISTEQSLGSACGWSNWPALLMCAWWDSCSWLHSLPRAGLNNGQRARWAVEWEWKRCWFWVDAGHGDEQVWPEAETSRTKTPTSLGPKNTDRNSSCRNGGAVDNQADKGL